MVIVLASYCHRTDNAESVQKQDRTLSLSHKRINRCAGLGTDARGWSRTECCRIHHLGRGVIVTEGGHWFLFFHTHVSDNYASEPDLD